MNRSHAVLVATAAGSIVAVLIALWIAVVVLPSDPQAAIALIYLGPAATIPGAIFIGATRPSARQALVACAAVHACTWLALMPQSGVGSIVFGAVLLIPTLLVDALVVATVGLFAMMLVDIWKSRPS